MRDDKTLRPALFSACRATRRRSGDLAVAQGEPADPGRLPGRGRVVQIFFNPASGSYSARRIRALGKAFEGQGATVIQTGCSADPPAIAENVDHVCIAGGDGTVRDIVNAMTRDGRATELSIYPMGTINLLAREMLCSSDPQLFVGRLFSADPARLHFPVSLGDGQFFVCASVGPDSVAVARISPRLKRLVGRLAYAAAFFRLLLSWPRHAIRLEVDGRTLDCEAFYLAKGRYFAGPWSFAPQAAVDQPALHLVAFARMRRRDFAVFAWTLLRGKPVERLDGVTCLTCTALSAECDAPLPLQADGDIIAALPVRITLGETALSFR
jgi:diacylglycerol kinase family enzyme